MDNPVAISICIPAYKNVAFLERLLTSVSEQTFTDYELVITDDSTDQGVQNLVNSFNISQPVRYLRNNPALGTPENWNESIRQARGEWIKMMHNDDWFASPGSLGEFYQAVKQKPGCSFFFSAFQNVTEGTGQKEIVRCNAFDLFFLKISPLHLFRRVYVGNPSCTLIKKDVALYYDRNYKFVVDFEYYIRCFRKLKRYHYIDTVLMNIGFHDEQVTKYTFLVPEVQIPENIGMLGKFGNEILYNPVVYDYYWRMFRNLRIRKVEQVKEYHTGVVPPLLTQMIRSQALLPASLLKFGIISKVYMLGNYLVSLFRKH